MDLVLSRLAPARRRRRPYGTLEELQRVPLLWDTQMGLGAKAATVASAVYMGECAYAMCHAETSRVFVGPDMDTVHVHALPRLRALRDALAAAQGT